MSDAWLVGKAAVARFLDCTPRQVERYEQDAGLPLPIADRAAVGSNRGHLYDPLAIRQWDVEYRRLKSGATSDSEAPAYDYNAERARLTKAQADKTELEVAELRGSLIRVPAVIEHWQQKIGGFRARLLSLPSKLAPQIAAPDKLVEAQDRAQALVYEALIELAGDGIPEEVRTRIAAIDRSGDRSNSDAAAEADSKPVGDGKAHAQSGRQRRTRKVPAQ